MKLKHKKPCDECPWRRSHMPGWLGGYEAEDYIRQIQFDGPPLPCHKTFPEGNGPAKAMCAGALIFMKNSIKSAQHPDYGDAMQHITADKEAVFTWPHEFLQHHSQSIKEWLNKKKVNSE